MTTPTSTEQYLTRGGITVRRTIESVPVRHAVEPILEGLDQRRGALLTSSYEYPGRYTRWDLGFIDPPVVLTARGRHFRAEALNARGRVLLPALGRTLSGLDVVAAIDTRDDVVEGEVRAPAGRFTEEDRSRQPSVFSLLRALVDLFFHEDEPHLGLYGAFGYDLAFQFEPVRLKLERPPDQRDLVLYLPDELIVVDHRREVAQRRRYEFEVDGRATDGLPRDGAARPYVGHAEAPRAGDHEPGDYAALVRVARESFKRGDLFEVVPGQTFYSGSPRPPSELFRRLREWNPSPYGFLISLGEAEYLVGASPEMYVRVDGDRVETCPISGTIARGRDPIGDAAQILALLSSAKDASELTMCTDVDRNDKSRICVPGSVRVIGRRQIEMYSRLIHTVDHVEGRLLPGLRRARRLPRPHLGGDRDRRPEAVGDAVHRRPRALGARLVRRRRRPRRVRRQPQYRPHAAHRPREGRHRRGPRRRDAALRLRSRRGGARDASQGLGLPRRPAPPGADGRRRVPWSRPSPAGASGSSSWTIRIPSCTRSPTTCARRAPR